jgi:hypothetical protein
MPPLNFLHGSDQSLLHTLRSERAPHASVPAERHLTLILSAPQEPCLLQLQRSDTLLYFFSGIFLVLQ